MGGEFADGTSEHNPRCDTDAAAEVLAAGIPTTVIGLDVPEQLQLTATDLAPLGTAGPLGAALVADIGQRRLS